MSTENPMLPPQAAPIDRTPAGAATCKSQAGVDASFDWGSLIGTGACILGGFFGLLAAHKSTKASIHVHRKPDAPAAGSADRPHTRGGGSIQQPGRRRRLGRLGLTHRHWRYGRRW